MPNCPEGCRCAHNLATAMLLLGVGRSKLYALMGTELEYVDLGYGRRIRHDVITKWLDERTVRRTHTDSIADACGQK